MESVYQLTEWDKARIALLNQERVRLMKQIETVENEIHHIFERTPLVYQFYTDDEDDMEVLERLKLQGVISMSDASSVIQILETGDDQ